MDAPADIQTELLRRLYEGDVRGAGHLLVVHHADEVYGLCRAIVRDSVAAEDLSQDVFARAFAALPRFRGEASTRTWILRIARNRCIDHLRQRGRQPWSGFDAPAEPDAQPAEEPTVADLLSRREDVEHALGSLDEGERALVVLRFGHGLGYPELADAFGIGQGAARMRVSRAVKKMRDAIETPAAPSLGADPRRRGPPAPAAPAGPQSPSAAPVPLPSRSAGVPPAHRARRGGWFARIGDALFGGGAGGGPTSLEEDGSGDGSADRDAEPSAERRAPAPPNGLRHDAPTALRARIDALLEAL